jgi:cytochrome oxidase assembly protein ShyY1
VNTVEGLPDDGDGDGCFLNRGWPSELETTRVKRASARATCFCPSMQKIALLCAVRPSTHATVYAWCFEHAARRLVGEN